MSRFINKCHHPEAVFKEKHGAAELTITSSFLIVDSGVQPSTPTRTNATECFPDYSKMEQPIGKGRVQGGGGRTDGS
jgi:hypothetical protein